ncbi:unnamed protein product [Closterium sp. NIES-65]|nr:unnamed protein product [Closterium sp. NIES-65]
MSLIATIPVARSSAGPFAPRISPPFRVRLRNPPLNPTFRLSLSARITFRAWQPFPRIPPASAACRVGAIRNSPPAPFGAFRSWRIRLSATAEAGGAAEAESAPGALALPAEEIQERRREAAGEEGEGTGFRGEGTGKDEEERGNGKESAERVSGEEEGGEEECGEEECGEEGGEEEGGEEGGEGEDGEDWVRMAATEESVGICCYANDLPGIHGVLKQRFADFIVNEVAPDGTVVHLTHLHVPPALLVQEQQAQQQARRREAESLGELVDAQGVLAQLRQALGGSGEGEGGGGGGLRDEDDARKLLQLLEGIKGIQLWWKEKKRAGEEGEKEGGEEGAGGERAEGSVQGGEVGKMGEVGEAGGGAPPPMPEPVVFAASADKAFHVLKENKDTNEAMALVGRYLGVQPRALGFSGTKDKRAVTVQRVTVSNQSARKVASLNAKLFGIRVGDYRLVDQPLVLGQLAGNRFIVTLRAVRAPSVDAITAAAEGLGSHGIINYFGLQRFGVGPVATHTVGAALLRGDWQGAVDLLLKPRDGDILSAPGSALSYTFQHASHTPFSMPLSSSESLPPTISPLATSPSSSSLPFSAWQLSGLKRNPRNLVQALGFIPRTMRLMFETTTIPFLLFPPSLFLMTIAQLSEVPVEPLLLPLDFLSSRVILLPPPHPHFTMNPSPLPLPSLFNMTRYVHSYQSYLWNHAASHRIKTYGSTRVVAGDLVLCSPPSAAAAAAAAATAAAAAAGSAAGVGTEVAGMRGTEAEAEAEEAAAVAVEARAEGEEVRVVSEEEAERGVYTINQVVLPLPGCAIEYPTNSTAQVFHSLAAKDGIDLFTSKHSVKEYSIERIPGGYRRLLQRPSDYNWRVLAYWRPTQVLAETDLDRIAAAALATPAPTPTTSATAAASAAPPAAPSVGPAADSNSTAAAAAAGAGAVSTDAPAATASGDAAAMSGSDAPAVVEAAHVYYGFKQPGYKGALKQAQRGEEKAGVTAGGAPLSGVEAATGEAGAGGEAAGPVPAVVVLASSEGVRLGRDELERLGIGEGPIGALVEGGDGEEGGPERGEAEAGAATEDGEKAEGVVESEMENGKDEGGDEKEKVLQGEQGAGAGNGEGKGQAAGRRGERGVEGAAEEGVRVALQVEFTLPASGYATMAIRELLKSSTAVSATNHVP